MKISLPVISKYKIGTFSISTGGNVVISGVGFKPKIVIISAANDISTEMAFSVGVGDGTNSYCIFQNNTTPNLDLYNSELLAIATGAADFIVSNIISMNADGFTLNNTLTGICTAKGWYLAIG